jgi:glutathione S-transferase
MNLNGLEKLSEPGSSTKIEHKFKLIYFDDRGPADLIKLILSLNDQQYENIQIKNSEWNNYKQFMPFEQLPVLIVNDLFKLAQTNSICRYLSKIFNLNGANEIESAMCDMVLEQIRECFEQASQSQNELDLNKRFQSANKFLNETLPKTLDGFQKMLGLNNDKFLVGNQMTCADLALINSWEWMDDVSKSVLNYYPLVKNHNECMRKMPKISEFYKSQKPLRVLKNV